MFPRTRKPTRQRVLCFLVSTMFFVMTNAAQKLNATEKPNPTDKTSSELSRTELFDIVIAVVPALLLFCSLVLMCIVGEQAWNSYYPENPDNNVALFDAAKWLKIVPLGLFLVINMGLSFYRQESIYKSSCYRTGHDTEDPENPFKKRNKWLGYCSMTLITISFFCVIGAFIGDFSTSIPLLITAMILPLIGSATTIWYGRKALTDTTEWYNTSAYQVTEEKMTAPCNKSVWKYNLKKRNDRTTIGMLLRLEELLSSTEESIPKEAKEKQIRKLIKEIEIRNEASKYTSPSDEGENESEKGSPQDLFSRAGNGQTCKDLSNSAPRPPPQTPRLKPNGHPLEANHVPIIGSTERGVAASNSQPDSPARPSPRGRRASTSGTVV